MIKGVEIFEIPIFNDDRGHFITVSLKKVKQFFGLSSEDTNTENLMLFNQSKSKKGVLRGMHQQINGKEQAKLVSCPNGKLIDLIVDYRKESETFMKKMAILLDKPNKYILVPKGCLHGFISLEDETILNYYVDNEYSPENESAFHWELIKEVIDWDLLKEFGVSGEEDLIISEKDQNAKKL